LTSNLILTALGIVLLKLPHTTSLIEEESYVNIGTIDKSNNKMYFTDNQELKFLYVKKRNRRGTVCYWL